MKFLEKKSSNTPKNEFLISVQKELNSYLSIPDNNKLKKTTKTVNSTVAVAEYQTPTSVLDEINYSISKRDTYALQKIKSAKSIIQINKVRNAITVLEDRYDYMVAKKYLIGFLEEKGFTSFKGFVDSLS